MAFQLVQHMADRGEFWKGEKEKHSLWMDPAFVRSEMFHCLTVEVTCRGFTISVFAS